MFLILLMVPVLMIIGRSPLDIAISTIAVCFLIHSLYWRDFQWLKSGWVMAALLFWLFTVLNSFQAYDVNLALKRSVPYIRFPIFAIAVSYWIIRKEQDLKLFVYGFVAVLAFSVADGLFEYLVGFDFAGNKKAMGRLSGPFEISTLGVFLTKLGIPIMIAFMAFASFKSANQRILFFSFFALLLITILLSGERMSLLLMFFALLVSALLLPNLRKYIVTSFLLLIMGLGASLYFNKSFQNRIYETTIQQINEDPKKSGAYKAQFYAALEIIKDHPILGIGANNYRLVCLQPKYDPKPDGHGSRCLIHPHNIYLELWVNNGLVGLILFCIIIFQWCKLCWHYRKEISKDFVLYSGCLGMLLFLWPLSVGMSIFSNFNGILFWLMIGFMLAIFQLKTKKML